MPSPSSVIRQIQDRDLVDRPDHGRLLSLWRERDLDALGAITRFDSLFGWCRDELALIHAEAPGVWRYLHFGDAIAAARLPGDRPTAEDGRVGAAFAETCDRCIEGLQPCLAVERGPGPSGLQRFELLLLPFRPSTLTGGVIIAHLSAVVEADADADVARLRDMLDTSSDWTWETDRDHRIVFISEQQPLRASGPGGAPIGMRRVDLPIHPDDMLKVEQHQASLDRHEPFRNFVYRVCIDGQGTVWTKISGKPVFGPDGSFCGYRGTGTDVTSEFVARLELEESRTRFKDFAEAASDSFWETDTEHRFTYVSSVFDEEAAGSMIGKTRRDARVHPEDTDAMARHFEDLEARRPFKDFCYRRAAADGGWIWIEVNGKPIFAADGTFLGYRGSASNVTDDRARRQALTESRRALHNAERIAGVGHWTWTPGEDPIWSPSMFEILSFDPDGPIPGLRSIIDKALPEDQPRIALLLNSMLVAPGPYSFEGRMNLGRFTEPRFIRFLVENEFDDAGNLKVVFGVAQDVTEIRSAQHLAEDRAARLSEAQRLGRLGDWSQRLGEKFLTISPELRDILRLPPDFGSLAETVASHYLDDGAARVMATQAEVLRTGETRSLDVQARRGDGSVGDFTVIVAIETDQTGRVAGFKGTVQDISERKSAERQLEQLAYFDALTGLANRARFTRKLEEHLARAREGRGESFALLVLDLDRFKETNDTLGHQSGDELLAKVGEILAGQATKGVVVARLGGDEFAVLAPNISAPDDAAALARRIMAAITRPIRIERGEVYTGASVGVVILPRDGQTVEQAMRCADLALYAAKDQGRGRLAFFSSRMIDELDRRHSMARDLRRSLEEGLLECRYQPMVDLNERRVAGFEVLMRWNHPERGYVSPSEFIPVAENSRLICDIGSWILRKSCRQGRAWLDAGEDAREVSVNVSPAQLWQSDLEREVALSLEETGLPPGLLCIELTESLFVDSTADRVRRVLHGLKKLGVKLALDDFGNGYSSLGYLNQLPFDKLKIDRCFVDGIVRSQVKRNLLGGIVALGRGLGMKVVVEGAERPEEVDILRELSCDVIQGYVFSRPVESGEALAVVDMIERDLFAARSTIAA